MFGTDTNSCDIYHVLVHFVSINAQSFVRNTRSTLSLTNCLHWFLFRATLGLWSKLRNRENKPAITIKWACNERVILRTFYGNWAKPVLRNPISQFSGINSFGTKSILITLSLVEVMKFSQYRGIIFIQSLHLYGLPILDWIVLWLVSLFGMMNPEKVCPI